MRRSITALVFSLFSSIVNAQENPLVVPNNNQISSKVVGYSVWYQCPDPFVVDEIKKEGKAIGAEYTEIVPVLGQRLCPSTLFHVRTPPSIFREEDERREVVIIRGGVTLGIHYATAK